MALPGCRKQAERRLPGPRSCSAASVIWQLADIGGRGRPWPVPFEVKEVLARRGRPTAVLASGDPFWHGVGGSLAPHLSAGEWIAHPAPSTFSLAAARLGWRLEDVVCVGLHAAPFERLVPLLARGARIICLVRDGKAAADLAGWLTARGWGASRCWTLSALGGPRERIAESRPISCARRFGREPAGSCAGSRRRGRIAARIGPTRTISSSMTARSPSGRCARWRCRRWRRGQARYCGTSAPAPARFRSSGHWPVEERLRSRRATTAPPIFAPMPKPSGLRIGSRS